MKIHLRERERKRKREREREEEAEGERAFVYRSFPDGSNCWDWARAKPLSWSSLWISRVGARAQALASSAAFPGTLAERAESENIIQTSANLGCWQFRQWLNLLLYNAIPMTCMYFLD